MDKGYSGLNTYKFKISSDVSSKKHPRPIPKLAHLNGYVIKVSKVKKDSGTNKKKYPFSQEKYSPIKIPKNAKVKKQSKNGYEQIKYNWTKGKYKYESRWHTSTPRAPNKKQSWVVTRKVKGNYKTPSKSEILVGKKWVSLSKWNAAIKARKNGIASKRQLKMLERGHFTKKRGK